MSEIECSLCHRKDDIIHADKVGWDWWTGYLPERFAVCQKCRSRGAEDAIVKSKWLESRERPR